MLKFSPRFLHEFAPQFLAFLDSSFFYPSGVELWILIGQEVLG